MNPTFAEKSRAPGSVKHRVYLELMEVTSTLYAGALITYLTTSVGSSLFYRCSARSS